MAQLRPEGSWPPPEVCFGSVSSFLSREGKTITSTPDAAGSNSPSNDDLILRMETWKLLPQLTSRKAHREPILSTWMGQQYKDWQLTPETFILADYSDHDPTIIRGCKASLGWLGIYGTSAHPLSSIPNKRVLVFKFPTWWTKLDPNERATG